jgi:hypothetical protein
MSQDTRVIARRGARELTPHELSLVQGGTVQVYVTGNPFHLDFIPDFG